jgi:hypothetical protein
MDAASATDTSPVRVVFMISLFACCLLCDEPHNLALRQTAASVSSVRHLHNTNAARFADAPGYDLRHGEDRGSAKLRFGFAF